MANTVQRPVEVYKTSAITFWVAVFAALLLQTVLPLKLSLARLIDVPLLVTIYFSLLRRNKVWAEIQQDVRMLVRHGNVGKCLSNEEETAVLHACLESRSRCLYPVVSLALNTGMRHTEIRLLQWK